MKHLFKHLLLLAAIFVTFTLVSNVTYADTETGAETESQTVVETEAPTETETETEAPTEEETEGTKETESETEPETTPEPTPVVKTVRYSVKSTSLKVHSKAGSNYKVVGKVYKDNIIAVTKTHTNSSGTTWGLMSYNGLTGWVNMKYLTSAHGWTKINGTWKYYKAGKVQFSSNAMRKAYNKIKNKTSSHKYYIVVDRANFHVFAFKKVKGQWTPWRSMMCAVGKKGWRTPTGNFSIMSKWDILKSEHSWEYYPILFSHKGGGSYCFHSTLYYKGVSLKNVSKAKIKDNTVGKAISHGCVRLVLRNAKWLWVNCSKGTPVMIY